MKVICKQKLVIYCAKHLAECSCMKHIYDFVYFMSINDGVMSEIELNEKKMNRPGQHYGSIGARVICTLIRGIYLHCRLLRYHIFYF